MPNPLISSIRPGSTSGVGGRSYDYTKIYGEDKFGEEVKDDARVWNVYLDEAEGYDADMIQGFRDVIDGLLVFAALFSAIVTTFVVQTSQALQPDGLQIIASLLVENNHLLRAAGNTSAINATPPTSVTPGSFTPTNAIVWINGLFFSSLGLSLSTALLTVLVKQWLQAYVAIVSGTAKDRALVRHFRFKGIIKWKLHSIIESLPLLLHASVAIFFVGLSLYVSELNMSIFWSVASISVIAFAVYIGTALLPVFCIECPFRIPLIFRVVRYFLHAFTIIGHAFLWVISKCFYDEPLHWPTISHINLRDAEFDAIFPRSPPETPEEEYIVPNRLICDALFWMFDYSSNLSLKEVVVTALCELIDHQKKSETEVNFLYRKNLWAHNLIPVSTLHSLRQLASMDSKVEGDSRWYNKTPWTRLINNILRAQHVPAKQLFDSSLIPEANRDEIQTELEIAFRAASLRGDHILAKKLFDWGSSIPRNDGSEWTPFLHELARMGHYTIIEILLNNGADIDERDSRGHTALHYAAERGRLRVVIALVGKAASLSPATYDKGYTPLDLTTRKGYTKIIEFLLEHGACFSQKKYPLHWAGWCRDPAIAMLFLDKGLDRTVEHDGETPYDVAVKYKNHETADVLQNYATVPTGDGPWLDDNPRFPFSATQ